jgi:hypothetical protein
MTDPVSSENDVQPTVRPPTPIFLSDVLASVEVIAAAEAAHKDALLSIGAMTTETLRTILVQWAQKGFPNAFVMQTIPIRPPERCSDGVHRSLSEYVSFVTGSTMQALLSGLQARLPDFSVSFASAGTDILIVVSKPYGLG